MGLSGYQVRDLVTLRARSLFATRLVERFFDLRAGLALVAGGVDGGHHVDVALAGDGRGVAERGAGERSWGDARGWAGGGSGVVEELAIDEVAAQVVLGVWLP